jgi:small subunit ribosomal protein S16
LAVAIRLTRVGATKRPAYRVIAIDKRRSRDGRALEILGFYDPLTDPATVQIDSDKIRAWIGKGAQPSDMVVKLLRQADEAATGAAPPKPKRTAKPKASKKAQARAAAPTPAEVPSETTTPPEAPPAANEAPAAAAADEVTPVGAETAEESATPDATDAPAPADESAAADESEAPEA